MYCSKALIFVDEIMTRLHICENTAYRLMRSPGFPLLRCGKLYVIDLEKYLAWERSRGQPGSTARGDSTSAARTVKKIVK